MTDNNHPMLELRRLNRFFGDTRAVDDVSFQVDRGQVFGYIGPNGAGKTTSMRVLATLDQPTSGDALVDGFSVVDDPDRVRRRLGFMPDHFGTYSNVTVAEYLDFFGRAYQLVGQERHHRVEEVMGFTGLDVLAEKATSGLSKGMKQRLCLGRSLIHDPAVLVLDEPAAGLDPRARIELREMIRALADQGKTVLISSHILSELAEICDTVGIIECGRLVAVGSVDEIRNEARMPHARVEVRVLEASDRLAAWLDARKDASDILVDGTLLHFSHEGTPEDEAALLRAMIEADFRVTAFGCQHQSLEDVFMQITTGAVQ